MLAQQQQELAQFQQQQQMFLPNQAASLEQFLMQQNPFNSLMSQLQSPLAPPVPPFVNEFFFNPNSKEFKEFAKKSTEMSKP